MNVRAQKVARGWTNLRVGGLRDIQRVRLGSFALGRAAVPAYEAIVLDTDRGATARVPAIVNARTGAILARTNLTDNFSTARRCKHAHAVQTITVQRRALPATDGACDVSKGPYTVGPGVRALSGFAAATLPTNDVVFNLFFGASTTPLITADTLPSPEQFRYSPAGGVPPGDYFVQVCDFADGAAWATPRTYTGTVTIDDSPAPPAYWARWKAFPANPPLRADRHVPVGQSEHRHPQDVVLALGRRAATSSSATSPRASPWDYDARTNVTTFTTSGNNNKAATSWATPRRRVAAAVHAGEQPGPRLLVPVDERLEQRGSASGLPRRRRARPTTTPRRP